ncbi:hypothetical protein [Senegalia massiliensis]|uniref:Uncharacterized protein n=1 Tax=Senegalia massiliensis TaxID=1720316 RepID=A0A845R0V5_9CLOT|nr:hypothetical protein [Senegalia massiliensis]NBI07639.1 hypothetical protein [Senegalia massiliensis]
MKKISKNTIIKYFVFEVKNTDGEKFNVSSAFPKNIEEYCRRCNLKINKIITSSSDRNYIRSISDEI